MKCRLNYFMILIFFSGFIAESSSQAYENEDKLINEMIHNIYKTDSLEIINSFGFSVLETWCSEIKKPEESMNECFELYSHQNVYSIFSYQYSEIKKRLWADCSEPDYKILSRKLQSKEVLGEIEHIPYSIEVEICDNAYRFTIYCSKFKDRFYLLEPPRSAVLKL